MYELAKLAHLTAGIFWLGGMSVMLWAVRPALVQGLEAPLRPRVMHAVLRRFFQGVWLAVSTLLLSGAYMFGVADMSLAPKGWHAMAGIGVLMCLIFAHLWFVPYQRLKAAVAVEDWPRAAKALGQIQALVVTNFALGWVAVAAVLVWR